MKLIPLTQGQFAMVDDEDFERASRLNWKPRTDGHVTYAQAHIWRNGIRTTITLHRFVKRARRGQEVDHKNRNGLDCQKENLRICTRRKNCRNGKVRVTNKSGFKGVSFHKAAKKYQAQISVPGIPRRIGLFDSKIEAAIAYDAMAVKHYGEFARTNQSMGLLPCP